MTNLEINTPQYFRDTVETLLKRNENYSGTLEEYLRALWALVDQSRQMEPSWSAFLSLLEKAFSTAPTDFDPNWLVYEQPLDWGYVDGVYVLNKLENHKIMIVERNVSPFRILEHTLLFEIADLYRMRDDQLKLPHAELYLGITSPTKNAWYNFHVGSFLECATSPMNGNTQPLSSCSWVDLAEILTLGRLYE